MNSTLPAFGFSLVLMAGVTGYAAPSVSADEACKKRFVELLVEGNQTPGPARMHAFSDYAGNKSENYFYSPGPGSGDGVMEPLKGMGKGWVLFREMKMYTSNDAGKSWKFVRKLDKASDPAVVKETIRKDSASAVNTVCGEEKLDGVVHDTVQGEYKNSMLQGAMQVNKYWVNRETGWLAKYETRSGKFHNIQVLEPAPDFVLPKPE